MARKFERESRGDVIIARTVAEARAAMASGKLAMVMHIKEAEAIDANFYALKFFMRPDCVQLARYGAGKISLPMVFPWLFQVLLILDMA